MIDHSTPHSSRAAAAQIQRQPASSNRILVVDDDSDLRWLCAGVLVHAGYQVDTAEDGEIGWQAIRSRNYALLITDNRMPKVSGIELVEKLRSAHMALPVILVSGAMPEELSQRPWLHLAATLLKPFTDAELLGIVKQILGEAGSTLGQITPQATWQSHPSPGALRVS